MSKFEVKEEFLLDGKPVKLLSGAVHYFRILPEYWENCFYNLKAMGFNTVETYIPWNIHEPEEGVFDFSGNKDVVRFIRLAQSMGLMVILRPPPLSVRNGNLADSPPGCCGMRILRCVPIRRCF